jgi:glycosyltransferase involved in cell wall biosynthesis
MPPPRVTVIIATFNRSDLLPYSIGSVLRQTFEDFEVLVVGDGCTDDSAEVVATIGDARVRFIGLGENSGHQSAPNNEGIRQSRGDLVAYLGHDDLWLPNHLQAHVAALDTTGADLAASICALVAPNGKVWPLIPCATARWFSAPSAVTHRRSVVDDVGGWRDYRTLKGSHWTPDVEFWHRASARKKCTFVRRLTAIKIPAAWRRNVYRVRATHEQRQWLERIDREPDLEATLWAEAMAGDDWLNAMPYRDIFRLFAKQTATRVRRRLSMATFALRKPRTRRLDEVRRFRGL